MMLAVALLLAFAAVVVGVLMLQDYAHERQQLARTLHGAGTAGGSDRVDVRRQQLAMPMWERAIVPALKSAGGFARRFTPMDVYRRVEQDLVYAGNPPRWDAERVLAFKVVLPIGFALLGFTMATTAGTELPLRIAMTVLFGAVGYYVPEWILRSAVNKRQTAIRKALPDTLDLLSITVEAGLSFDAALVRVAQNTKGPLGQELYRVVQEGQLGRSRGEALRDLATRTNVDALRSFILAMVQADAFGIPIAQVLKVQASEIRLKRRQQAEEEAQKLPVKIVFPLILGIFPAIFVVLVGPAAIQIYEALVAN